MGLMGSLRAQSPFALEWHGFVNPHYYADSRSVVGGREDMMLFYPKPIVKDSLGRDINDGWQANMLANQQPAPASRLPQAELGQS